MVVINNDLLLNNEGINRWYNWFKGESEEQTNLYASRPERNLQVNAKLRTLVNIYREIIDCIPPDPTAFL